MHSNAYVYRVEQPWLLRTSEYGNSSYSHNAFEKGIMKNKSLMNGYRLMISQAAKEYYIKIASPGDKLLIYCSTVDMCTKVVEHLKTIFPDKSVMRYVDSDPYENLMTPDIRVTTLLSAGTGMDVPGLISVILTTAITSSQANIQGFGRLREIKDKKQYFVYFVCQDVQKHLTYHLKKKELLQKSSATYKLINYPHALGKPSWMNS